MTTLPNEILAIIFSFFEPFELFTIQQLSKYWRHFIWSIQTQLSFDYTRYSLFNSKLIETIFTKMASSPQPIRLRSLFLNLNGSMNLNLSLLTTLTTLYDLEINNIPSEQFCDFLPFLSHLTHFSSNYLLNDVVWTQCTHWTRLRKLHVFVETPHFLHLLSELEDLDIQFQFEYPTIQKDFFAILPKLTRLQRLHYRTSFHIGSVIPHLSSLPFLTELKSCCCVNHEMIYRQSTFGSLIPLTSLESLILSKCFLTQTDCSTFLQLFPKLRSLRILHTDPLESISEKNTDFITSIGSLIHLTMLEVKVDENQSLHWLTSLTKLRHLEVFSEGEETNTPQHWEVFQHLTNLTFLYLDTYINNKGRVHEFFFRFSIFKLVFSDLISRVCFL
jgi:hypothetical protein